MHAATDMKWCLGAESNHRHADFQSAALPTELPRHMATWKGLEPSTSSVTGWHSNQLNYQAAFGGNNRARTCDPLLVRQVLSQLSYAPKRLLTLSSFGGDGYYNTRNGIVCQHLFSTFLCPGRLFMPMGRYFFGICARCADRNRLLILINCTACPLGFVPDAQIETGRRGCRCGACLRRYGGEVIYPTSGRSFHAGGG